MVDLHHEAVDVWLPADTVQRCILPLHAAGLGPRRGLNVRQITILKGPERNHTIYSAVYYKGAVDTCIMD